MKPMLDREEPEIFPIYEKLVTATGKRGQFAGIHNATGAYAARMIGMGFRFVTIANDRGLMAMAARTAVAQTRKEAGAVAESKSVLLANATLPDGRRQHIQIEGGRIAALLPTSGAPATGADTLDLTGAMLLPPLVDGHIHLDKTLLGLPWVPNQATGNRVADRIEAERRVRAARTMPEAETGANLVRQVVASGTLHMRSHVDIDNQLGLKNLHAILKMRERFRDLVTIQIVAFPQSGICARRAPPQLLDAAIAEGADLVGGLDPVGIDGDLDGHLDAIFAIAERRGVGIDIHLHDSGEGGIAQLTAIAQRTRRPA